MITKLMILLMTFSSVTFANQSHTLTGSLIVGRTVFGSSMVYVLFCDKYESSPTYQQIFLTPAWAKDLAVENCEMGTYEIFSSEASAGVAGVAATLKSFSCEKRGTVDLENLEGKKCP